MDYRSRRDLEKILGDLDHDRQEEREKGRADRIRQAGHVYDFERVAASVLKPALRDVMGRLERRGHAARMLEPTPTRLRLDIVLQATTPVKGWIEIELDAGKGLVSFRGQRQHHAVAGGSLPIAEISDSRVAAALVEVLRGVTEEPPKPAVKRPW